MIEPKKLIFIIVRRGECKRVVKKLNAAGFAWHTAMLAHGTAPSEVQAVFGLSESEKAMLVCVTDRDRVAQLFDLLNEDLGFKDPNTGIAFSVNVTSLAGLSMLGR